jgi:beta-N-acetylhexosaminidase
MERLEQVELVPFQSGIAAGTDAVMTAHIYFPALMGQSMLPATLSPAIVRQLLRGRLGYQGISMTDCLEMNAVARTVGVSAGAVMALQAGNDLLLISHLFDRQLAAIKALETAVLTGEISREQLAEAAQRIITLKQRLLAGTPRSRTTQDLTLVGCPEHQTLSQHIYERSITLVRDTGRLLPLQLQPGQRLLLVYPQRTILTQAEDKRYPETFLVEQLRLRHSDIEVFTLTAQTTAEDLEALYLTARTADVILMLTVNALLDSRQVTTMQGLLHSGRPVIGLAAYSPYDLLAFPALGTYLTTCEYTRPAIAAAIRVLFGDIQPQGKLPVSLPGLV